MNSSNSTAQIGCLHRWRINGTVERCIRSGLVRERRWNRYFAPGAKPSAGVDSVAPKSGTGATANRPAPDTRKVGS